MKTILRVKNFGPITDAELDLRNVNVLIGPQASGKSTLAKLYTICKSPVMYHKVDSKYRLADNDESDLTDIATKSTLSIDKFFESLSFFGVRSFFSEDTVIEFESATHSVQIKGKRITFEDKIEIDSLVNSYKNDDLVNFSKHFKKLAESTFYLAVDYFSSVKTAMFIKSQGSESVKIEFRLSVLSETELRTLVELTVKFKDRLFLNKAMYIPAERTIVNLLKQASLNLRAANVPIPSHLLDYAAQYETATFSLKKLNLHFLCKNTYYQSVDGNDLIYFRENKSIPLTESASGLQSVVPMLLPIEYTRSVSSKDADLHHSFVIEELETNLFPKAQYDVLKFLEKGREDDLNKLDFGSTHTYTTHSPYVLSALNNMLYAYKLGNDADELTKNRIDNVLGKEHWINPKHFSAYEIKNGKAKSIFNRKTGLIKENVVDAVSEDILEDFRKIALASMPDKE
jgi:predicted ATPase